MKKVLSLILAIAMLLSMGSMTGAAFDDVDSNFAWAEEAINDLSSKGIITGYEDGTFKPGRVISRQEAITLFSKTMGASEKVNEPIVNLAYGIYESDLGACSSSYAVKQGAYLIYRSVFSVDEVIDYLSTTNRDKELYRYEAATLIAKALGADSWFKNNPTADTSMKYDDVNDIPAKYIDYVYYTTALGIMGEMDTNKFCPLATVTRAQVAVMIHRILNTMEFEFVGGVITTVDTLNNNLAIRKADGEIAKFGVDANSVIFIDGSKVTLSDLDIGMEAVFTFSQGALYEIDAISVSGDAAIAGAYKGQTTNNSGTTIKIADILQKDQPVTSYKVASNVTITVNGTETDDIKAVKTGDYVTIELSNGLVVSITAEPKSTTVTGVKVTEINTASDNGVEITVADNGENVSKYILADDATITRNANTASLTELVVGDTVNLTLEYGIIKVIRATGIEKKLEGTIEEITISNATSYITISNNGSKSKYVMARDCKVELEGESASVYDLRLGAFVKLTTSSSTVTEIKSEAITTALSVTGKIKTINTSYGLVVIQLDNGSEKQLFVKDTTKILDSTTNKLITLKNLKVGNVINAAGTEGLGVYEVNSIMVLQQ